MAGHRRHNRAATDIKENDTLTIVGALVIPLVAYFLLPAIPASGRSAAGLAFGALLVIFAVLYFGNRFRSLRSDIAVNQSTLTQLLVGVSQDDVAGILHKGAIRNVSLRVATAHRLVNDLLFEVPDARRAEALRNVGIQVGRDWGRTFVEECRRARLVVPTLDDKLRLWSDYDATAGMGRFHFGLGASGSGTVTMRNGFLSDDDAVFPLDYFFAGYLEGALGEILERSLIVQLLAPTTKRHEEAVFAVGPNP